MGKTKIYLAIGLIVLLVGAGVNTTANIQMKDDDTPPEVELIN